MEHLETFKSHGTIPTSSARSKASTVSSSSSRHSRSHPRPHSTRPGSVPPASHINPLEIHSSPIHLATRSLSARSSTTSLISSGSLGSKPSTRSMPQMIVKQGTRGKTQTKSERKSTKTRNPQNGRTWNKGVGVTSETSHVPKGFNIPQHVQDGVDRSSGCLSPDMDQFLQDVNSVMTPPTPDSGMPVKGKDSDTVPSHSTTVDQTRLHTCKPTDKSHRPKLAVKFGSTSNESTDVVKAVPNLDLGIDKKPPTKSTQHSNYDTSNPTGDISNPQPNGCVPSTDPNLAASKIQQWYRNLRGQHQQARVQSLLRDKREELNQSKLNELKRIQHEVEDREQKEMERQKRREAKMQAARKVAIESLQKKREEKRQTAERIAQEEIALLQASGKIKKARSQKKTRKGVEDATKTKVESAEHGGHGEEDNDRAVEEFFKAGSTRKSANTVLSPKDSPQPPTTSQPTTTTTYSDLMDTLKLLEEPPAPLNPTGASPRSSYLSADNLRTLDPSLPTADIQRRPAGLSDSKLQSIITYLDEIEKSDEDLLTQLSKSRSEVKTVALPTAYGVTGGDSDAKKSEEKNLNGVPVPSELEAATTVATDVTATILTQRMELENKSKTVEMLQKALTQQRELTVYHAKQMEKEGQKRLELQKEEYDAAIQRHQCFIDQLIDDKKVLSERCEQLVKELKELDKKYKTKIKTMEETYKTELTKLKQVAAATDKLRREKWQADETQRIKEATVKSLEPEIQRIIAKGKSEIQKLKALHEAEMLQVDERASRRFVSQMEELRAQCAHEKEQACAHERELARQRYEKLAEQEEVKYQQQRRKLFSEVQTEREKLDSEFHHKKTTLELQMDELQREHDRFVLKLKTEHAQELEEAERRSGMKVRDMQERMEIERQTWEENLVKKQDADIMTRERELRELLRKERDREIEMVITRLEEETAASKEETERAAGVRVQRLKDKYEAEVREVERSERSTLEKFSNMKIKMVELEGDVSRLQSLIRHKEEEVKQVSEVAAKLTKERDSVTDIVRQEFADRLVSTEEENKQLKIEMSELRARQRIELERVGRVKEKELGDVHERVKQALSKKDENIKSLRQQYDAVLKRADHLEMLLERQRKELLKK